MPGCGHRQYVVLHSLQCRGCQSRFYVCVHCYRGHRYCGPPCRDRARRQQLRAANARHQRSELGRLDHNHHQRAYRERLRASRDHATGPVTYPSSPASDSASSCGHDLSPRPLPIPASAPPRPAGSLLPGWPAWRCSRCGRPGIPLLGLLCWCLWCALHACPPTNAP